MTKTYRLTYEPVEVMHALFDRTSATQSWKISARRRLVLLLLLAGAARTEHRPSIDLSRTLEEWPFPHRRRTQSTCVFRHLSMCDFVRGFNPSCPLSIRSPLRRRRLAVTIPAPSAKHTLFHPSVSVSPPSAVCHPSFPNRFHLLRSISLNPPREVIAK